MSSKLKLTQIYFSAHYILLFTITAVVYGDIPTIMPMSESDFLAVETCILKNTGIRMPVNKSIMCCIQLLMILLRRTSSDSLFNSEKRRLFKNDSDPPLQNEFPVKCMRDLGCFPTGPPFYDAETRPLMLLPFDEKHMKTIFKLFTPGWQNKPHFMTHEFDGRAETLYKPDFPTKIIIHGFGSTIEKYDLYCDIKNAMLKHGKYNVFIVDWSIINKGPTFQAYANARVVGAQIGRLVKKLIHVGATASNIHIIGHSLGGAIAAFAATKIKGLGRITALDPGAAYFKDSDPVIRLDANDADFVDVIITNGAEHYWEGFGTLEPIGHVNYYVNGGRTQPGCARNKTREYDYELHACSHTRVLMLFAESIESNDCRFLGTPCSSYENFKKKNCTLPPWWKDIQTESSEVIEMGFYAKKSKYIPIGQKFYLNTKANPDFCINNV